MTGLEYEHLVGKYLSALGYTNVKVTQGSGDYGVDIIASKDNKKYAIQCKLYSNHVGISAVQEVAAGMAMYGCTDSMVITNNVFTQAAKDLARVNGVILLENITPNRIHAALQPSRINSKKLLWYIYGLALIFFGLLTVSIVRHQINEKNYAMALFNSIVTPIFLLSPILIKFFYSKVKAYITNSIQKKRQTRMKDFIEKYKPQPKPQVEINFSKSSNRLESIIIDGKEYGLHSAQEIESFPIVSESFYYHDQETYFNRVFLYAALGFFNEGNKNLTNAFFYKAVQIEDSINQYGDKSQEAFKTLYDLLLRYEKDEEFAKAFAIAICAREISRYILLRKMRIGYQRGGELLDELERRKYIAPYSDNVSRKVYVTFFDVLSNNY